MHLGCNTTDKRIVNVAKLRVSGLNFESGSINLIMHGGYTNVGPPKIVIASNFPVLGWFMPQYPTKYLTNSPTYTATSI